MRHSMIVRSAAIAVLATAVIAVSGCHWFGKGDKLYQLSAESRPLEVPPDLDKPNTEAAVQKPAEETHSATRSAIPAPAAGTAATSGFTMAGERDDVFAKLGTALAATEGVTIASKAQLLGAYDVNYAGGNFLVRVSKVDAGIYVSAVDPRGMPATSDAAIKLIAALKVALGAN